MRIMKHFLNALGSECSMALTVLLFSGVQLVFLYLPQAYVAI